MKDREFLMWIHDRLVMVHKEEPLMDYMWKLRCIIEKMDPEKETPNILGTPIDVLRRMVKEGK